MARDCGLQPRAAAGAAVRGTKSNVSLLALLVAAAAFLAWMLVGLRAAPVYAQAPAPDNGYSSLLVNSDGHLEAFARAQDGVIFHSWEGVFGTWYRLAGPTAMQGAAVAGLNADGRGEAFAVASNGVLMHTWQPAWPTWIPMSPQPSLSFVCTPAASRN